MFGKRLQYGILLVWAALYYVASGEWLSRILLLTILSFPFLSLLVSLPVILDFTASVGGTDAPQQGEDAEFWLLGSSNWPMPLFRGRLRVENCLTGKQWKYTADRALPTDHVGGFRVIPEKVRVCDYLGLFAIPVRKKSAKTILVRPNPEPIREVALPQHLNSCRWVPKHGGGFAENHEHRPYRPGDPLNQVHWKLSAKVNSLIIREPMEAVRETILVTMVLNGTPTELDLKFGRLLWLGRQLLDRRAAFDLRVQTGQGLFARHIASEPELADALDTLLCTPVSQSTPAPGSLGTASWQYHIGGEADET